MKKVTEQASDYSKLEQMDIRELLVNINREDQKVPGIVERQIPQIEPLVKCIVNKMGDGGRLFYLGAGTSGRLGILDASECPPTFGVPHDWVIGLIAGGDGAIRKAVEFAEDNPDAGWNDLLERDVSDEDFVLGIAASGTTPYVVGALKHCREHGIKTGCITCNPGTPLAEQAEYPVEVVVGPEFVTGSTRMKAGTAQKLVLNMISTATMIRLGRVFDNQMVDMELANQKLVTRGKLMIMHHLGVPEEQAMNLLEKYGSVRKVLQAELDRDSEND